jgi:hypothetical protein
MTLRTPFKPAARRLVLLLGLLAAQAHAATSILFVGNSFTFGARSAVQFYKPEAITDLDHYGFGGIGALFQRFADQTGLDYRVFTKTEAGAGLDWHLKNKTALISGRRWDQVVLQSYSTLDADKPGDPDKLVASAKAMAEMVRRRNPRAGIYLLATWPRADQVYQPTGAWYGKTLSHMADEISRGYEMAAAAGQADAQVIPVGQGWMRAMRKGVADDNPYDGIDAGKVDLWGYDHYHASAYGSYLEALIVFGKVTGLDPHVLGSEECSSIELGFSSEQTSQLQDVAAEILLETSGKPLSTRTGKPRWQCRYNR